MRAIKKYSPIFELSAAKFYKSAGLLHYALSLTVCLILGHKCVTEKAFVVSWPNGDRKLTNDEELFCVRCNKVIGTIKHDGYL